jgi:hypothetical protein
MHALGEPRQATIRAFRFAHKSSTHIESVSNDVFFILVFAYDRFIGLIARHSLDTSLITKRLLALARRSLLLDDVMLECSHDTFNFNQLIFIAKAQWLGCLIVTFDSNEACCGVIVIVISLRCCARIRSQHINWTTFQ